MALAKIFAQAIHILLFVTTKFVSGNVLHVLHCVIMHKDNGRFWKPARLYSSLNEVVIMLSM